MSSYYYGKKQIQNGVFNDNKFNYTEKPVSYGSIDLIVQENDNTDQEQTDLINNVITAANQLNTLVSANTLYQSKTDVLETNFNAVDGRITTIENTPTADNTALITDIWTNSNAISVINTINNTQTTNIANLQTYDTTNTENINLINTDISNIQEKTNLITKNNLQLEFNEDIKMIKKFKCDSTGQLGPSNNRIMLGTNLFSANNGLELYFDNVNDKAIINGKKAGALHTLEINGHNLNDFDTRINTLEIQPAFDNSTNVGDLTTLTTGQSLQLTMINNNINDITNNTSNITTNLNSINAINTGISNIDNTTDLLKPISTATTTQLNLKASQTDLNTTNTNVTNNLNSINTINTNISNLDNTTDLLKPVSTEAQTALNLKLDSSYVQNVTSTEHNYLSNVTSNIQSQLNAISATSYDDTTVKADISANTANIATNTTNINNKLNSSYVQNVTSNEHSYLSNVTSNIQTQFNNISNYDDTPVNTNATNIATNTTNIATNTTNITGKQANQTGNKTTLGSNAINNNAHGTVIGYNTKCSGSSIVIGSGCCKTYGAQNTSVIIGGDACYYGNLMNKSVIIGHNTAASYGGSNCTAIGYDAGTGNSPHTLGASSTDKIILGDNNITTAYIAVAWSVVSDIRDKCNISSCDCLGLDFINGIDVIKYKKNDRSRYCTTLNNKEDGVFETTQQTNDGSKKDEKFTIGVSAQQIQTLENQLNSECADNMIVNDDDADKLSVRYQNLIMPLINAVKELTYMNTDLLARIEVLENA